MILKTVSNVHQEKGCFAVLPQLCSWYIYYYYFNVVLSMTRYFTSVTIVPTDLWLLSYTKNNKSCGIFGYTIESEFDFLSSRICIRGNQCFNSATWWRIRATFFMFSTSFSLHCRVGFQYINVYVVSCFKDA